MELSIDEAALAWFQEEVELESGDRVKFHPRYGGRALCSKAFLLPSLYQKLLTILLSA